MDLSAVSEFFLDFSPYETHDFPSTATPSHHSSNEQRFNPYSRSTFTARHSSDSVQPNAIKKQSKSGRFPKPTPAAAAAAGERRFKNENHKNMKHANEYYGEFDPSIILHEHSTLVTHIDGKKPQFWFFLLKFLMEISKKNVISWTGRGREFKIFSMEAINSLWAEAQGKKKKPQVDSVRRTISGCYKRRIMIPVDAVMKLFVFKTEPSIHIGMTRDQLTIFIAQNNLIVQTQSHEPMIYADNSIYPTPDPSADRFFISNPDTVSPSTTVPRYVHPFEEIDALFDAPRPIPIDDDGSVLRDIEQYWTPPVPVIPQSYDQYLHELYELFSEY